MYKCSGVTEEFCKAIFSLCLCSCFLGVLELKSVKPGHVVIRGQSSSMFLCVDSRGTLKGQSHYTETDCTFREQLLADGYSHFTSLHHGVPVSLAKKLHLGQHTLPFVKFLPLRNVRRYESVSETPQTNQRHFNLDSDDPVGMALYSMASPQFSLEK
uniref:Fibroblast growth factor n=1 Tax=Cynoglossus semilaevis TaxID=244447 RepID=A0A3P8WZQ1_CYNSE